MAPWVSVVARISFYAGGRGGEKPRWLIFGDRRQPLEVLGQVEVGEVHAGRPAQRVWLVRAHDTYFRVRAGGETVLVDRWEGSEPPASLADLLA